MPSPGSSASAPLQHDPLCHRRDRQAAQLQCPEAAWLTDVRNGLTLGDLHVKQKNYSEANAAYHNAQDQLDKDA